MRISDWNSDVCSSDLLAPGTLTPEALKADIETGVYLTELIGQGVNPVTGDYSRGASGFVIRGGQLAEPIAEFTVAGNLIDMFGALTPADDLVFRQSVNVPTLRIHGMRSEEHTSELQSIMRIPYAIF